MGSDIKRIYEVAHFVKKGETISSVSRSVFPGGKGLNQSVALGRAGSSVWHAGCTGETEGKVLLDTLEEAGVQAEFVSILSAPGGHAIIQKDEEGDYGIILYGGANQEIDPKSVDCVLEHFGTGDYIVRQNEISSLA